MSESAYTNLDARLRALLHLPRWVSPIGLLIHVVVGLGVAGVLGLFGAPRLARVVAALLVGLAHEQAETDIMGRTWADFRIRWQADGGGFLNGTLDVLAFVVGAAL